MRAGRRETVKKVSLELGGNAPFIVFDDADLDAAVEGAMISKFRNMGQTCVCANRILVQAGIYDAFVAKLTAAVGKLKVGDGTELRRDPGAAHQRRSSGRKGRGACRRRGEEGGQGHDRGQTPQARAHVQLRTHRAFRPRHHRAMRIAKEETFGPVAPVFRFKDEADADPPRQRHPSSGSPPISMPRDLGRVWRVAEALEYGMVGINSQGDLKRARAVRRRGRNPASAARARATARRNLRRAEVHADGWAGQVRKRRAGFVSPSPLSPGGGASCSRMRSRSADQLHGLQRPKVGVRHLRPSVEAIQRCCTASASLRLPAAGLGEMDCVLATVDGG